MVDGGVKGSTVPDSLLVVVVFDEGTPPLKQEVLQMGDKVLSRSKKGCQVSDTMLSDLNLAGSMGVRKRWNRRFLPAVCDRSRLIGRRVSVFVNNAPSRLA